MPDIDPTKRDLSKVRLYTIAENIMLALLVNYRQRDGRIPVPEPLDLPDTTMVVGVYYQHESRSFGLVLQDESFEKVPQNVKLTESGPWPHEITWLRVVNDQEAAPVFKATREMVARIAWEAYRDAVGGLSFDGKPLPDWSELIEDSTKIKIVQGWLAVADTLRDQNLLA